MVKEDEIITLSRKEYDQIKKKRSLIELVRDAGEVLGFVFALGYSASSVFIYGPIDTIKVVYSEIFSPELKMQDIREAQALYAKRLGKNHLDEQDRLNFFKKMGLVNTDDYTPRPEDVKYSILLDYIEKERGTPWVENFGPDFE